MTPNKKARLKVEYVPIRSVKPAKGNTRQHPPEQIQEIGRSIEAFGWTKPIIVDERREILAGHGAYQAALQLGLTEVPIIARHGLNQAQKRAYRTADNKIGENSKWDMKLLGSELKSLQEMGFDMTLTGFQPVELARRAIKNSSLEGEGVLDFFAGSGSTLIAAEQLKRVCYAIELDPQYVDAIVRRWQNTTKKDATHAKEKKTFEAIAKARAGKAKGR